MATVVRMPEVLANASEATIQSWLVSEGQQIAIGDPLAEIETDKALVEYAAEVEGVLARLIAAPGATISVGDPIAVVLAPGETSDDLDTAAGEFDTAPGDSGHAPGEFDTAPGEFGDVGSGPQSAAPPGPTRPEAPGKANGRRLFATPLVRKLAQERGIDLHTVNGSGPGGRIVRRDLDRLPAAAPAPTPSAEDGLGYTDIPVTGMRKAIARRLTESKSTVPHFYLTADCRVDALLGLRRTINSSAPVKVSVNDFVLKAVAGALVDVPEANAIWTGDAIRRFAHPDIAVVVAVDGGLVTPVLRGVESMALSAVSQQVADVAERARAGRIHQHELDGGSFSVSNLGMYGVTEFSAILNPPHSGILAVGAATQRPVVADGQLTVGAVMTVSLSADHRVVDGAVAAAWMAAFVRRIENPLTILI